MNQSINTCATCHWWEKDGDGPVGFCHRFPPTGRWMPLEGTPQFVPEVPVTHEEQWCGEYKQVVK